MDYLKQAMEKRSNEKILYQFKKDIQNNHDDNHHHQQHNLTIYLYLG